MGLGSIPSEGATRIRRVIEKKEGRKVGKVLAYFTDDGTYGGLSGGSLIVLDVSRFNDDEWDDIVNAPDGERMFVAMCHAERLNRKGK